MSQRAGAAPRRADNRVSSSVAAVLGTSSFAASFTHIHDVAAHHHQTGWIGWGIATSVELMSFAAVAEIRSRSRANQKIKIPVLVLLLGVAMSLGANLNTAGPGFWGMTMAAWPAIAFLSAAVLVESRPARTDTEDAQAVRSGASRTSAGQVARTRPARTGSATGRPAASGTPAQASSANHGRPTARTGAAGTGSADSSQPAGTGVASGPRTALTSRPSRQQVIDELAPQIAANADWRPDYPALMDTTGYGKSWCEKTVAAARAQASAHAPAQAVSPPSGAAEPTDTAAPEPAAVIVPATAKDSPAELVTAVNGSRAGLSGA